MRRRRKSWVNRRSFTSPADTKELPLRTTFPYDPTFDSESSGLPSSNPEQGMGLTRTSQEKEKVVVKVVIRHPENPELILFGLRRDDQAWCTPGGHCESEETPEDGMFREFNEECGLELESVDRVFTYELPDKPTTVHIFEGYGIGPDDWEALNADQDPDSEFACFQYINPLDTDLPLHIPFEHNAVVKYLMAASGHTAYMNSLLDLTTEKEAAGGLFKKTPPLWRGSSQAWAFDGVLYDATQNSCHLEWVMRYINLNPGELQGLEYQFDTDSGVIPPWFYEKYPTAVRVNANAFSFETLRAGAELGAVIDEVLAKKPPLSPEAFIYIDLHAPTGHMKLTVNDYLERGLKPARKRAILRRKHNEKTDTTQWALLSKKAPHHVLKWFGSKRPSDETVAKEERRIHFFEHKGALKIDPKNFDDAERQLMSQISDENWPAFAEGFKAAAEKAWLETVSAGEASTFRRLHTNTTSLAPGKTGPDDGALGAAVVFRFEGTKYVLDGQTRVNRAIKAETPVDVALLEGDWSKALGITKAWLDGKFKLTGQAPDLALFKRTDESSGDRYHNENQFESLDHLGSKPYDSNGMSPADDMRESLGEEMIVQYASMGTMHDEPKVAGDILDSKSNVVHSEIFKGVKIDVISSWDKSRFWVYLNDERPPEGRVSDFFFSQGVALEMAHDMVPSLLRRKKITTYEEALGIEKTSQSSPRLISLNFEGSDDEDAEALASSLETFRITCGIHIMSNQEPMIGHVAIDPTSGMGGDTYVVSALWASRDGHISFAVDPNFQRQGLAKELIKSYVAEAKDIGLEEVTADAIHSVSAKLLMSLGFEQDSQNGRLYKLRLGEPEVTIKDAVSTENSKGIGVKLDNERESIHPLKDFSIRTPIQ